MPPFCPGSRSAERQPQPPPRTGHVLGRQPELCRPLLSSASSATRPIHRRPRAHVGHSFTRPPGEGARALALARHEHRDAVPSGLPQRGAAAPTTASNRPSRSPAARLRVLRPGRAFGVPKPLEPPQLSVCSVIDRSTGVLARTSAIRSHALRERGPVRSLSPGMSTVTLFRPGSRSAERQPQPPPRTGRLVRRQPDSVSSAQAGRSECPSRSNRRSSPCAP
jgi:hypothetical protein